MTHHAAVKSTNTLCPDAVSCSTRPGSQACQPFAGWLVAALASCNFMTFGPIAHIPRAQAAIETVATTARTRPFNVKAQITSAINTSKPSNAPAPSMPLCWPSTHTSHTTVANMGNAISCLKVTIHGPGRGRALATAGTTLATRYGMAMPKPIAPNTANACTAGKPTA